ncbi:MAG: M42 family metallopeptidase [Lachnospiraceae bacterium]
MNYEPNRDYILCSMKEFINTPSPVSYYDETRPLLERYAQSLGYTVSYDRKKTPTIMVNGEDDSKTVCISAHLDTLGLIIKSIDTHGMIHVRNLGGINFYGIEGATVTIHTRDGKKYTGLMACQSHSVHVFDNAQTLERNEDTMMVILDEDVNTKEDVKALGIENGDIISIDPQFTYLDNGYIKSRFIDDKASVACSLDVLRYLSENNIKPAYDTHFTFPYYEEVGHGAAYISEMIDEFVALDIALIGPDNVGEEDQVSICVKDAVSPYDRELTDRLVKLAKKIGIHYAQDVFYHYSTDATAAVKGGNNVAFAAFGMGTFSSHGVERTHITAVEDTARLAAAYVLGR